MTTAMKPRPGGVGVGQLKRKIGEDIGTIVSWGSRAIPMCEHGRELDGLGNRSG